MKLKNAVLYFEDGNGNKQMIEFEDAKLSVVEKEEYEGPFLLGRVRDLEIDFKSFNVSKVPKIKNVIHSNNVCTILWDNDTKTQATCHPEDIYNKDTGVLVAFLKKFMPTKDVIELVEKWSHQQLKQEDIQARKKADKARKQAKEELDQTRRECEAAKAKLRKQMTENTVLFDKSVKKDMYDALFDMFFIPASNGMSNIGAATSATIDVNEYLKEKIDCDKKEESGVSVHDLGFENMLSLLSTPIRIYK